MKKFPKPWFRPARGVWFVTLNGKQHNLGPDKDAAFQKYHDLMSKPRRQAVVAGSVAVIFDQFLEWVSKHRAPDTYRWYKDRLQVFKDVHPSLLVSELKPYHVQQWIDAMGHSSGTKRNYVRAVKRSMSWAEEQGLIDQSPIRHLKKPRGGRRDNVISPELHGSILQHTKDQNFRDLCDFGFQTGARCSEILAIEGRHLDLPNHRVIFPIDEEKMERAPRIIYLNEQAEAILQRLAGNNDRLFVNTTGLPWTPAATNCRFRTLKKKIGKKVCLTDYRHSFTTRLLAAGVDALTVSILLGHSDTSMMAVYAHINHESSYLMSAVRKASLGA